MKFHNYMDNRLSATKIISVVGARPNFMKIASIIRAIDKFNEESHGIDYGFKTKNYLEFAKSQGL